MEEGELELFARGIRHQKVSLFVICVNFLVTGYLLDWQREIFKVIRANPQHRFYFLTKQPRNLAKFSPFPDNCWIGVTVCDKQMASNAWWYYFDKVSS